MEPKIESYQEMRVWQVGMDIGETCYMLTRSFPKEEIFGFTSQIRRASVSIPANIAEGFGRQSPGDYAQFLRIARGSLKELETHLLLSVRVGLAQPESIQPILRLCDEEGRMLQALIRTIAARTK